MERPGNRRPASQSGVTSLGPGSGPQPGQSHVTDAYVAGMRGRLGSPSLPKADLPRAGGRMPAVPDLRGSNEGGQPATMAELGAAERGQVPAATFSAGSIVENPQPESPAARLDIRPTDLLPPEAKNDPSFRDGHGAMYAAYQPDLAEKYGVVRGGQRVAPQQLILRPPGEGPKLRPETVRDLETLQQLQRDIPAQVSNAPRDVERTVAESSAGAAATVGAASGGRDAARNMERVLENLDDFQFNRWREAVRKDVLNTDEQRKLIEGRLTPMSLEEYLTRGYTRQKVPIRQGYTLLLESYDGEVDLALKRLATHEARSADVSEQYIQDKYSFFGLTVGLHAVNSRVFPAYRGEDGHFNDDLFLDKFSQVMRLPIHVLASIGINIMWFEQRVRDMLKAEDLGNG